MQGISEKNYLGVPKNTDSSEIPNFRYLPYPNTTNGLLRT